MNYLERVCCFRWVSLFALSGVLSLQAQWEFTGAVGVEGRVFFEDGASADALQSFDAAGSLELELFRDWDESRWTVSTALFARWDAEDPERQMVDLREFWWQKSGDRWDLRFGVGRVFWGVAESQHLVDVINQSDLRESLDGEAKLGQPMVNFDWITNGAGTWGFFYLPYFREREFPGVKGRLRPFPGGTLAKARYMDDSDEWTPSWAVRWAHSIGEFDLGVSYFDGMNREPGFEPVGVGARLRPVYGTMRQQGLDLQWTRNAWLWKAEALSRQTDVTDHSATTVGFEYTFYGVAGTALDVGVLGEHHHDSRGLAAPTLFDDDVFGGARLAWNDAQDTSLLAGVFWDRERGSTSWRVEFQRRLGQDYRVQIEAQGFAAGTDDFALSLLDRDTFVRVELLRYF